MFVAENFIGLLVSKYGKNVVYPDGGTWYSQACNFLYIKYRLRWPLEKSLIERVMQYFKDITEGFDDYYHVSKRIVITILVYNLYTIRLNYSFVYIMQELETYSYLKLDVKKC